MDFLTDRPQQVRFGRDTSSILILNTGAPQGCVLSPMLFTLFTHDCTPIHTSNSIIRFAANTTVVGLILDNEETAYRLEVEHLAMWCKDNNLVLNTSKTKEMIIDFRRTKEKAHLPFHICGEAVESVENLESKQLTWTDSTSQLVKKAQQRLLFLRKLKQARLLQKVLLNF